MKRVFALILALMLCSVALAEVDVKGMTDEELKQAYKDVMAELTERRIWEESTLPAGMYVGGVNMPEGSYTLTMKKFGTVRAWSSIDKFVSSEDQFGYTFSDVYDEGEQFTIMLTNGICWVIEAETTIHPFMGPEW